MVIHNSIRLATLDMVFISHLPFNPEVMICQSVDTVFICCPPIHTANKLMLYHSFECNLSPWSGYGKFVLERPLPWSPILHWLWEQSSGSILSGTKSFQVDVL